jgi:methyl-accepting chemotaxis protein
LADVVAELQKSVVRVVRTATAEVDRREVARYAVDWPCRLAVPGHGTRTARLTDLSSGGAAVADGPALSVGSTGTLQADRIGVPLPFVVRAVSGGMLHLAFELDACGAERLEQVLDGAAARNAA